MVKANCITRALDQWNEDKSMRLWYNANHVVVIEETYYLQNLYPKSGLRYLPLESFGTYHFITSFQLSKKHLKLLGDYFNSLNQSVDIK
jgi:hypothetical protein